MTPEELKTARIALGMNQYDLADALGLRSQTISNYEVGKNKIPVLFERAIIQLTDEAHRIAAQPVDDSGI